MNEDIPNIKTNGFKVLAKSIYVPEMSDIKKSEYFFAYLIRIINESEDPATLRRRYWKITDGFGDSHIVKGEGVIGEQPTINPGKYHAYSSYCPLKTTFGFMEGHYEMEAHDGSFFNIKVPTFQLITPGTIN
tara:strand:+ start:107 stop:502 length:396 start_codon:yes stop_codon:yes gene_type:complete